MEILYDIDESLYILRTTINLLSGYYTVGNLFSQFPISAQESQHWHVDGAAVGAYVDGTAVLGAGVGPLLGARVDGAAVGRLLGAGGVY